MIDVEGQIFAQAAKLLRDQFAGIDVSGVYVNAPEKFPHVSIEEIDNFEPKNLMDSSNTEKYSEIVYKVDIYSNAPSGRKTEAKAIAAAIDEFFRLHNFRRFNMSPVPNMQNATIYRISARYRAISDGKNVYRK